MKTKKLTERQKKNLAELGGRETTVQEWLSLSDEDMAVIEARAALRKAIKKGRKEAGITQTELAKRIGSSQSRVALMENGDPQASIESMLRALRASGYRADLKIARTRPRRAA